MATCLHTNESVNSTLGAAANEDRGSRPTMIEPSNSRREGDVIDGEGYRPRTESATVDVQRFASARNVVHVSGDLSRDEVSTVHRLLAEELARSPAQLALDLRSVKRIDSAGIDTLKSAAALAAGSDISFCLVAAEAGPVSAALVAAHVRQFFEIFASVQDAWDDSR
jgi:anti-anti-sigma factor